MRRGYDPTRPRNSTFDRERIAAIAPVRESATPGPAWPRPSVHGVVAITASVACIVLLVLVLLPLIREGERDPCVALQRLAIRQGVAVTALLPSIGEPAPFGWPRCTVAYWQRM